MFAQAFEDVVALTAGNLPSQLVQREVDDVVVVDFLVR
jgi:hypothetical protein